MEQLRNMLLQKRNRWGLESAVSTGSTLLNLACTDTPHAGYLKGGYYYLVGDSASGKTWFSLSVLAEASQNPQFDKYRLIYDDVEGGALMDIEKYFGKRLAKRLESPGVSVKGRPIYSERIEDFYYYVWDALADKRPFIYILDSQDALSSKAAKAKFLEQKKASERGQDVVGSYGDGKAKIHSETLRQVLAGVRKGGNILIVIGQTRDNLGFGFEKKTRSGGRALRFYANIEIWTSVMGKIKRKVNGKDRTVGVEVQAEVRKNRVTGKIGKDRAVTLPIYYGLGIDDIGSCVDFLIEEGHWPKVDHRVIDAKDLLLQGTRNSLIESIEADGLEKKVRKAVARVWEQIELACVPQRKARYE